MSIWNWFKKIEALAPGLHHKVVQEADQTTRLHLRIEPDGRGILSINASKILHLNPTAAEITKYHMDGLDAAAIVKKLKGRYRIGRKALAADVAKVLDTLRVLVSTDQVCPITYLDTEALPPFQFESSAPLRMDCALTYSCNVGCAHCYNLAGRKVAEIPADQWKIILKKIWDAGIPHVTFTGGEPTLREDLPDLIQYAEELGLITGLLTNGRRLKDAAYVKTLKERGLDHVQITLESHDAAVHDAMVGAPGAFPETVAAIRNSIKEGLYTLTNTTLTKKNAPAIAETVAFLASLGLKTFACNGIIRTGAAAQKDLELDVAETTRALEAVKREAARHMMRFIWYTPTQYCEVNPVELGVGLKQCSAARYAMCVEPNGDVLPCQSYYIPVGNMLRDDWPNIWNHPLCQRLRDRSWMMEKCDVCEERDLCGGGCPLQLEKHILYCKETASGS